MDRANRKDYLLKVAGKYSHIDFKPPQSVANAASRGLELRKQNKGKGGLSTGQAKKEGVGSGVQRAVNLKNRDTLSPATVRRMKAFFDRHAGNEKASGGKSKSQDKGYISYCLWGGAAGKSWANKICRQMDAADEKRTKKASFEALKEDIGPITTNWFEELRNRSEANLRDVLERCNKALDLLYLKDDSLAKRQIGLVKTIKNMIEMELEGQLPAGQACGLAPSPAKLGRAFG